MRLLLIMALVSLSLGQTRNDQQNDGGLEVANFNVEEKYAEVYLRLPYRISGPQDGIWTRLVKVYSLQPQMKNNTTRRIVKFVWAYHTSANSPETPDKEFLCRIGIEPGQTREVRIVSPKPRAKVVDASASTAPPDLPKPSLKDLVVNQIQFADGTTDCVKTPTGPGAYKHQRF